jgi:hypothetical protein
VEKMGVHIMKFNIIKKNKKTYKTH